MTAISGRSSQTIIPSNGKVMGQSILKYFSIEDAEEALSQFITKFTEGFKVR